MYTQNSSRDLFYSQPWSQIDSQDWNTQISSQELNAHRVPSTPSGRVLPPTPSTSGNRNGSLSNSWSGRAGSQVVPQSVSYPSTPRGFSRENNFAKEIRFALHAVLSVMKDLPAKLREIILTTSENHINSDTICNNFKKIIEEKMVGFEKVFSLLEENESLFSEIKKLQELLQSSIVEFQKALVNQIEEMSNFKRDTGSKMEILRKQLTLIRKLRVSESKKIQTLLNSVTLRSNEIEAKFDEFGQKVSSEMKDLKAAVREVLGHVKVKEDAQSSSLSIVVKEMTFLRTYIRDLPSIIDMNNRKSETPLIVGRRNVRIAESPFTKSSVLGNKKCDYRYSPVARVPPQIKETPKVVNEVRKHDVFEKQCKELSVPLLDLIECSANKGYTRKALPTKTSGGGGNYSTDDSTSLPSPLANHNSLPRRIPISNTCNLQRETATEKFSSSSTMKMYHQKENVFFNRPANRFRPYQY